MSLGSGQNLVLLAGAAVVHSLQSLTDIVVLKADTSSDIYLLLNNVFCTDVWTSLGMKMHLKLHFTYDTLKAYKDLNQSKKHKIDLREL